MTPFLVLGANKTGTRTVTAAANAHPNVFCAYEADFTMSPEQGAIEI